MRAGILFLVLIAMGVWQLATRPPAPAMAEPIDYCLGTIRFIEPRLLKGLERSQRTITVDEIDTIEDLLTNAAVAQVIYFNKWGQVRWAKNGALIGNDFTELERVLGRVPAVEDALNSKKPVRKSYDAKTEALAVPMYRFNNLTGLLWLRLRRDHCPK